MSEQERVQKWLNGFYNHVSKTDMELLPLFGQRLHFFPRQDEAQTIGFGFDDLPDHAATEQQRKRMRELFDEYAADHDV